MTHVRIRRAYWHGAVRIALWDDERRASGALLYAPPRATRDGYAWMHVQRADRTQIMLAIATRGGGCPPSVGQAQPRSLNG